MSSGLRILVVSSQDAAGMPRLFLDLADTFTERTVGFLQELACEPVVVNINHRPIPQADALLKDIDGVLILGGGDVDSTLYGVPGPVPNEYGVDRVADDALIALILACLDRDVPLFGICRGSQLLNVALGGSLIPDIENWPVHRGPTAETVFLDEVIDTVEGSVIHELYGSQVVVKDGHHQAVDRVAQGIKAVGYAADGVVEAIEHESCWAIGVQWHPEHADANPEHARLLFGRFVEACRSRIRQESAS